MPGAAAPRVRVVRADFSATVTGPVVAPSAGGGVQLSLVAVSGSGALCVTPGRDRGGALDLWLGAGAGCCSLIEDSSPDHRPAVAGGDRRHRLHRRIGGDRRASTSARLAVPAVRACVDPGAQPLSASSGGSARRRAAGGGAVGDPPVLLRPRRLQRRHVRRAVTGVDRTAREAQPRPASSTGGHRVGAGRAGRLTAGRETGDGGQGVGKVGVEGR